MEMGTLVQAARALANQAGCVEKTYLPYPPSEDGLLLSEEAQQEDSSNQPKDQVICFTLF